MTLRYMRYLATGLVTLLLPLPALSVELFRYRGAAKDGGTLEYVFEALFENIAERTARYPVAHASSEEGSIRR